MDIVDFKPKRIVVWFSAGVTSAVAARVAIDRYVGKVPVSVVYCDTGSEDEDNLRFLRDVEEWLGIDVEIIGSEKYRDTFDVYRKAGYMKNRWGARCTLELKKLPRRLYENLSEDLQVFGYDSGEEKRAVRFTENNPEVHTWFPLIENGTTKAMARGILLARGIAEPRTYKEGFRNANCLAVGCIKGAKGYWNHFRKMRPLAFNEMAKLERELEFAINTITKDGERQPVFLDELPPDAGNYRSETGIQCGLFCSDSLG